MIALSAIGAFSARTQYSLFSTRATDIWYNISPSRPITIKSPDGLNVIKAQWASYESDIIFNLKGPSRNETLDIGKGIGSQVMWSPDSKAFSLTSSDWGGNGPYQTYIYYIDGTATRKIDINDEVRRVVDPTLKCDRDQTANVIAIAWRGSSRHLLAAGQVPHHSVCRDMGTFVIFEMLLPEKKIVRRYNQAEAKRRFAAYLGEELRDAETDLAAHR